MSEVATMRQWGWGVDGVEAVCIACAPDEAALRLLLADDPPHAVRRLTVNDAGGRFRLTCVACGTAGR